MQAHLQLLQIVRNRKRKLDEWGGAKDRVSVHFAQTFFGDNLSVLWIAALILNNMKLSFRHLDFCEPPPTRLKVVSSSVNLKCGVE